MHTIEAGVEGGEKGEGRREEKGEGRREEGREEGAKGEREV
jgi:hypothetical protein